MSDFKRYLLVVCLFLLFASLVFPPFLAKYSFGNSKQQKIEFVGHFYLFSENREIESAYKVDRFRLVSAWVDYQRLLLQTFLIIVISAVFLLFENAICKIIANAQGSHKQGQEEPLVEMPSAEPNAHLDEEIKRKERPSSAREKVNAEKSVESNFAADKKAPSQPAPVILQHDAKTDDSTYPDDGVDQEYLDLAQKVIGGLSHPDKKERQNMAVFVRTELMPALAKYQESEATNHLLSIVSSFITELRPPETKIELNALKNAVFRYQPCRKGRPCRHRDFSEDESS